jgi:hypothetical protein
MPLARVIGVALRGLNILLYLAVLCSERCRNSVLRFVLAPANATATVVALLPLFDTVAALLVLPLLL